MQVMHTKSNKSNQLNRILLYILPCIALAIIAALSIASRLVNTSPANAESSSDSMNVSVQAESLNVSLESNSIILDIAPTYEGIFKSTNPVKVYVDTTNTYGYNLIMTATTTTSLTSTVPLSDGTTYPTIATLGDNNGGSGYDSTNFPTNRWGYAVNGSNFLPVANSTTLRTTDGTDNTADRTNNLSFGTKLNTEITTGNYNITLNFVATTNSPSNLEDFDAAFIFAGKTKYNGYYKMQDMTANICSYVATPTTTTSAPSTQLIDTRDSKIYWVSKLKDGNCWMTQNLDFDINDTTKQYLTSEYTDLVASGTSPYATADGYSMDANGKITWTPVRNTIVSTTIGASFTWPNDYYTPYSIDLGDWYYRSDYYNSTDCNDQNCNYHTGNAGDQFSQTTGANGAHSHVGNYYSWSAAVASNNTNGYDSGTPANSICPKGWKLPANGGINDNGTYSNLNKLYNGDVATGENLGSTAAADKLLLASPLYFVRDGAVWSNALRYAGHYGFYWSSTIYFANFVYGLAFNSSELQPSYGGHSRDVGKPLRCLARTSISDITYMQEFATMTDAKKEEIKNTMVVGQAYQLIDNRDNEVYNVAKLADGNVWLLDNLRLDPATLLQQLTPANTNMDPNTPFTLPESSTSNNLCFASSAVPNCDNSGNDSHTSLTIASIYTGRKDEIIPATTPGKAGVFYNYCATTAGTYCYPDNLEGIEVEYDICPAGWSIPSGTEQGDYNQLFIAYGSNKAVYINSLRLLDTGRYDDIIDNVNSSYWASSIQMYTGSSVVGAGNLNYAPNANVSNLQTVTYGNRGRGQSIRCLLK